ncbi:MAG: hypothetical protein KAS95_07465 [Candidatus Heimdallarchaeota archaeon]|nr:hypothetical protein [Candidatus Heimdallarchaeota archaeon]
MTSTDKDMIGKTVVRKPKTFNPLGGIFVGLFSAGGHVLIVKSVIDNTLNNWFIILGILFIVLAIAGNYTVLSLSAKYTAFNMKYDKTKNFPTQFAQQLVLYYLGFLPAYGFAVAYSLTSLEFWQITVLALLCILLVSIGLYFNIKIMNQKEIEFGHLLQITYQPKKLTLGLFSLLPILASSIVIFFI